MDEWVDALMDVGGCEENKTKGRIGVGMHG